MQLSDAVGREALATTRTDRYREAKASARAWAARKVRAAKRLGVALLERMLDKMVVLDLPVSDGIIDGDSGCNQGVKQLWVAIMVCVRAKTNT